MARAPVGPPKVDPVGPPKVDDPVGPPKVDDPVGPPKADPPGGAPTPPKADPAAPGGGLEKPKDRYKNQKRAAAAAAAAGLGGFYYYLKRKQEDEDVKECVKKCVPVNWDDYIGFEDALWKVCDGAEYEKIKDDVDCEGPDVHGLGDERDFHLTTQITKEQLI